MKMNKVKWVKNDDLVSAVKVIVVKLNNTGFECKEFIFSIYQKNDSHTLYFDDELDYISFVDKGSETLPSSISIEPMLFRDATNNEDFLAREADDPELYHIITGMILDKLWEVLWVSNGLELSKYRKY